MASALLLGFLLGSLPFPFWFGALRGLRVVDGPGPRGTLAAYRALGPIPGLLAFLLEVGKGLLAVALGEEVGGPLGGLAAGGMAVLGHALSPWLAFRGGWGGVTALGVLFAVDPGLLPPALLASLLGLLPHPLGRALALGGAFPLLLALLGGTPGHLLLGALLGLALGLGALRE